MMYDTKPRFPIPIPNGVEVELQYSKFLCALCLSISFTIGRYMSIWELLQCLCFYIYKGIITEQNHSFFGALNIYNYVN